MSLAEEAAEFLDGIENHARAGNLDQVLIQARSLLARMESAIQWEPESPELRSAILAVREIISDGRHLDSQAVLAHVNEAKEALGRTPGVTPAWPTTPDKAPGDARSKSASPEPRHGLLPARKSPTAAPSLSSPIHEVVDLNTASAEQIRRVFPNNEDAVRQILENKPYRDWQDFTYKNPGFSEPLLQSLRHAGVTISRPDLNMLTR